MIVRTVNETDRRTVDLFLSEEGRRAAEQAASEREERHKEMFSCLSDEEKKTLTTLLEKINASWPAADGTTNCT